MSVDDRSFLGTVNSIACTVGIALMSFPLGILGLHSFNILEILFISCLPMFAWRVLVVSVDSKSSLRGGGLYFIS